MVAPVTEYMPEVHAAHAVDAEPTVELAAVPAAQFSQADAATPGWCCPPGQVMHAVWPVDGWKVPKPQGAQTEADAAE